MRKMFLLLVLCIAMILKVNAQPPANKWQMRTEGDTSSTYLKFPKLPAFNILSMDSEGVFNTYNIPKGHVTALILFDPDCSHCQAMVKTLTAGMDSLKDIRFYFVTLSRNMQHIRNFYKENHLDEYKNVIEMGRDTEFFFLNFYKTKSFPAIAVYDKHKEFMAIKEGGFTVSELYNVVHDGK